MHEIDCFLRDWGLDSLEVKRLFSQLYKLLQGCPALTLHWDARPEVVYSLRAALKEAKSPGISGDVALIDIIDDDPEERWLSIRLNAELIGCCHKEWEILPGGLSGHDALCIDVDENEEGLSDYLVELFEDALKKLA